MSGWHDVRVHVYGPHKDTYRGSHFIVETEDYSTKVYQGPLWMRRVKRTIRRLSKWQVRRDRDTARIVDWIRKDTE